MKISVGLLIILGIMWVLSLVVAFQLGVIHQLDLDIKELDKQLKDLYTDPWLSEKKEQP